MTDLRHLQRALGTRFRDDCLLRTALTHGSFLNENPGEGAESNERLEFLGDAVLGMVVAERLYAQNPGWSEGKLTQARAALVQEDALAGVARSLSLGSLLRMGRGEAASGGGSRPSNLSSALEALIGAVFLDQGYAAARDAALRMLAEPLASIERSPALSNPKSALQEMAQAQGHAPPTYRIIREEGDDPNRVYFVKVDVGGRDAGAGSGRRKAQAEQAAAAAALANLAQDGV